MTNATKEATSITYEKIIFDEICDISLHSILSARPSAAGHGACAVKSKHLTNATKEASGITYEKIASRYTRDLRHLATLDIFDSKF
ncbi:unnamed protein product [marine sediment metagenome]|uniref:Uncharacterized protein n=1 Tax=marine sediment metagenome TaxID=412755 RepID=X1SL10_9ZZZZ